ncbi:unnamed protein product [Paramecium octaurelia]|uniref:Uncharacterized protein n=1 Tax=Paramecium octaurelia TaxID=43137 RepID=A0A8S1V5B8_PAROT|nr:unnamed protein product [Paramecium octaurelia]
MKKYKKSDLKAQTIVLFFQNYYSFCFGFHKSELIKIIKAFILLDNSINPSLITAKMKKSQIIQMKHNIITLILSLLLVSSQAQLENRQHREQTRTFIQNFTQEFLNQYTAISAKGMDFDLGIAGLLFDSLRSKVNFHNFAELKVDFDLNNDILKFKAPTLNIYLVVIENKFVIPLKLEDVFVSMNFNFSSNWFSCEKVLIDYTSVSLDLKVLKSLLDEQFITKYLDGNILQKYINSSVLKYISGDALVDLFIKFFLSQNIIKDFIKKSEIPIRNFLNDAIRSNHNELKGLINEMKTGSLNARELVYDLPKFSFVNWENQELIINLRRIQKKKTYL